MIPVPANFIGAAVRLNAGDIYAEAAALHVPVSIIHAFSDIESGALGGFFSTGEPVILFEARYFHLLTKGQFDSSHPNVSSPVWNRSLYAGGIREYHRLREAMALDRTAALESCSIGRYQIMGANFRAVGFSSIDDMWGEFCASEKSHLQAFGEFCASNNLVRWMQTTPADYVRLAVGYNGAGERANGYDAKLAAADRHYKAIGEGKIPVARLFIGESRAEDPQNFGA